MSKKQPLMIGLHNNQNPLKKSIWYLLDIFWKSNYGVYGLDFSLINKRIL